MPPNNQNQPQGAPQGPEYVEKKDFDARMNTIETTLKGVKEQIEKLVGAQTKEKSDEKKDKSADSQKPAAERTETKNVRTNSADESSAASTETGLVPTVAAGLEKATNAAAAITVAGAALPNLYTLPILNKIPYLPQISASIYGGLNTVANYFGINTGYAATNSFLAGLPTPTAPIALGGLGLWGLGKLNEKITGRPKPSGRNFLQTMWNGVRSVYDFPAATLNKAGEYTKKTAGWVWDYGIRTPARIARDYVWNPLVKPMVKPTLWGVGGGFLGAAAAASVAGTPLTPAIALGFFGMNYLKNKGILSGKQPDVAAHAA